MFHQPTSQFGCVSSADQEDLEAAMSKAKQAKKKTNPANAATTNIQVNAANTWHVVLSFMT